MKVNLTLDVGPYERFVIAKYFSVAATSKLDRERTRATRKQIRRFAAAAVRSSVKDLMRDLPLRQHAHARVLADGLPIQETLPEPVEQQRALQW